MDIRIVAPDDGLTRTEDHPTGIPAVNDWGLVVMMLVLLTLAIFYAESLSSRRGSRS